MIPRFIFTPDEKVQLFSLLEQSRLSPYKNYPEFSQEIRNLHHLVPPRFVKRAHRGRQCDCAVHHFVQRTARPSPTPDGSR